jgi:hypothetical protein
MVVKQQKPVRAALDIGVVLRRLHSNNVRVGLSTFDRGVQVWISDRLHRMRADEVFMQSGADATLIFDSAARWLHEAVLRLFPGSAYARQFRVGILKVIGKAATAVPSERPASLEGAAEKQAAALSKGYRLKGHKVGNRL